MSNSNEVDDVIEDVGEITPITPKVENGEDKTDWQAEAKRLEAEATKYRGIAARNKTRAEKAKAKAADTKPAPPNDGKSKSAELDYGQKAFLIANGVKGDVEMKLVTDIMNDTGKPIESIIASPHFQGELKSIRDAEAAKAATPSKENGSRPSTLATDTVDYWIKKNELPPKEQVKLRQDVVNARLKQEKSANQFTDNPVVS